MEKFEAMQDCFREHLHVHAEGMFPVLVGNETAAPAADGENIEDITNDCESHHARSHVGSTLLSLFAYCPIASAFEGTITGMCTTTALNPGFVVRARSDRHLARLTFLGHSGSVTSRILGRRLWLRIGRLDPSGKVTTTPPEWEAV